MKREILILTGPIQSGKTTLLLIWAKQQHIAGILTPLVEGHRHFLDIETGKFFPMIASEEETQVLEIGKYRFSATGFEKATILLKQACSKPGHSFLVIDEIGPLELNRQKGFYEILLFLLDNLEMNCRIVLVVRDKCLPEASRLLEQKNCTAEIFTKDVFKEKFCPEAGH